MPKILCKCGYLVNLGDIPSPNQYLAISDVDYDKYFDHIDAEKLFMDMTLVVVCPKCKRLYVYRNGFDNSPLVYQKEEGLVSKKNFINRLKEFFVSNKK